MSLQVSYSRTLPSWRPRFAQGGAFLFAIVLGIFGTVIASGILRALAGLSLEGALVFCAAAAAPLLWRALLYVSRLRAPVPVISWCMTFAVTALLCCLLWSVNNDGLSTSGNGDSGLHLYRLKSFELHRENQYHGFVTFYAFVIWLQRAFGLDDLSAIMTGLYAGFGLLVALSYAASSSRFSATPGTTLYNLARAGMLIMVGVLILIPLYFEFAAQGAFPYVFGISAYLALWLSFAVLPTPGLRLVALAAGTLVVRHTYGLNLGDVLSVIALLLCVQGRESTSVHSRKLHYCGAILCAAAAVVCYYKLWRPLGMGGAATEIDMVFIAAALFCGAAGIAIQLAVESELLWSARVRFLTAVFFNLTINLAILAFCFLCGRRPRYYLFKYPIYSAILACAAYSGIVLDLLRGPGRLSVRARSLALALILSSLGFFVFGFSPYLKNTYRSSLPALVPRAEYESVAKVFAMEQSHGRRFAGFYSANWPRYWFVNTSFGVHVGLKQFRSGDFSLTSGDCVFWENGKAARARLATTMQIIGGSAQLKVAELTLKKSASEVELGSQQQTLLLHSALDYYCEP